MECRIKDFYILTIKNITYLNQEIYSNKTVEYKNTLYWDELILFKDCYATVYFDDKVHNIEPNDILYLPSGKHTQYKVKIQSPGDFIDIFFISNIHMNSSSTLYKLGSGNANINFQQILTIWQQNPTLNHAKCMSILWDIISKFRAIKNWQRAFKRNRAGNQYIHSITSIRTFPVEQLSTRCGVSYSQFLKIFEKQTSTTPKNYIIKLKMSYACELLKTDKSITEISEIMGFNDVYFFSKQFKKYMNISPTDYRKRFLQNSEFFNRVKPWEKI
ncbi:MAG: helix-turn-helix domain-containing protein [Oscillospiraceae bacterium]